eukprot:gene3099-3640_t
MSVDFFNRDKENRRMSLGKTLAPRKEVTKRPKERTCSDITVCIRKRPLTKDEVASSARDVLQCRPQQITVLEHKQKVDLTRYLDTHEYSFDEVTSGPAPVFDEGCTNRDVYKRAVRPLVAPAPVNSAPPWGPEAPSLPLPCPCPLCPEPDAPDAAPARNQRGTPFPTPLLLRSLTALPYPPRDPYPVDCIITFPAGAVSFPPTRRITRAAEHALGPFTPPSAFPVATDPLLCPIGNLSCP